MARLLHSCLSKNDLFPIESSTKLQNYGDITLYYFARLFSHGSSQRYRHTCSGHLDSRILDYSVRISAFLLLVFEKSSVVWTDVKEVD